MSYVSVDPSRFLPEDEAVAIIQETRTICNNGCAHGMTDLYLDVCIGLIRSNHLVAWRSPDTRHVQWGSTRHGESCMAGIRDKYDGMGHL